MSQSMSAELVSLLAPLIESDGYTATPLPGVTLMAMHRAHGPSPLIYDPCLIIVAQGHKVGYLGAREIHYGPGHYLVQTLPLPFECLTLASAEAPLLGVSVRLEPGLLSELVAAMGGGWRRRRRRIRYPWLRWR